MAHRSIYFLAALLLLTVLPRAYSTELEYIVAADGSSRFTTVQAAIDAIPSDGQARVTVRIRRGTYKEKILIPRNKPFIRLIGEDAKTTVLTNDWNARHVGSDGKPVGTSGTYSVCVEAADFLAENVTFENTAGDTGQAVALMAVGDRQVYRNCRLLGWQDTLYANSGRQYYDRCYIEGRVDFIFGNATAVFDHCELRSKNGGHVTAANTPKEQPWGFVFFDCTLTGDPTPWNPSTTAPSTIPATFPSTTTTAKPPQADLGRPWRPYASVTYVRCEMGAHVKPLGWDNWRNPENEKTARFAEYQCTGPGADRSKRVGWSRELSAEEGTSLTIARVLAGWEYRN